MRLYRFLVVIEKADGNYLAYPPDLSVTESFRNHSPGSSLKGVGALQW